VSIRSIDEIDIEGRRILIRVDFNVPVQDGRIADRERIRACLPTLKNALNRNAHVILASHLGRPDGYPDASLSLKPVARELSNMLRRPIMMAPDVVGPAVKAMAARLGASELMLLENLRFHPGETTNDPTFANELASYAHVYINDAFGVCHRPHASIDTLAGRFKDRGAGFLLLKEIDYLGEKLKRPAKPFVLMFGGAKVAEKIAPIKTLMDRAQAVIIGGAMAYTFLRAQGHQVGKSLVSEERLDDCREILAAAQKHDVEILLPVDHIAAKRLTKSARATHVDGPDIPDTLMGLDIGPKTIERYCAALDTARTVVWNGPMGAFEFDAFSRGTIGVARAVAANRGLTIAGGGDTISALKVAGASRGLSHVSTGGGAMLSFLANEMLPGITAIDG